jgi:peptide-methionine (S)-S-oxide reductase
MKGVLGTLVGYAGGEKGKPTYYLLGDHTETVLVAFDPTVLSYEELAEVFWKEHDPTYGVSSRQYRSVLFYHTEEQRAVAERQRREWEKRLGVPVRTAVEPAGAFHPAEDYHQKYYLRGRPDLMREFRALYPEEADFVSSTAAARLNGYLGGNGEEGAAMTEIALLGLSPASEQTLRGLIHR